MSASNITIGYNPSDPNLKRLLRERNLLYLKELLPRELEQYVNPTDCTETSEYIKLRFLNVPAETIMELNTTSGIYTGIDITIN